MNSEKHFGISWEKISESTALPTGPIVTLEAYANREIGTFYLFSPSLRYSIDSKAEDHYKALALIREKSLAKAPYAFWSDGNPEILELLIYMVRSKYYTQATICSPDDLLLDFPNNIIEREERSLMNLSHLAPVYGQEIPEISMLTFFSKEKNEFAYFLHLLNSKKIIGTQIVAFEDGIHYTPITIEERGWIEIEEISKSRQTKQAFMAMWFDASMEKAYKKVLEAMNTLGIKLMRIDKKQYNEEISGEILKEIKNSRFLIADITGQRNGVYFEAGFAMGLQIPVIWTCKKDDFKNVHFDTRQYNHVIWEDEEDLYQKIMDRVQYTILFD